MRVKQKKLSHTQFGSTRSRLKIRPVVYLVLMLKIKVTFRYLSLKICTFDLHHTMAASATQLIRIVVQCSVYSQSPSNKPINSRNCLKNEQSGSINLLSLDLDCREINMQKSHFINDKYNKFFRKTNEKDSMPFHYNLKPLR